MRSTPLRRLAVAATFALGAAVIPAATASASAVQDPIPIGPNTYFYGLVNGKSSNAVVYVVCPGPIGPNSTGHPVDSQSVEVRSVVPPVINAYGYTGSDGKQIDAGFTTSSSSRINPPIVFTSFFAPTKIPTTWLLPCGGSASMAFVPLATSSTARDFKVTVTFVNIAV
ncbi:MAG: hypothetical protein JF587_16480 [Catenulisporales bacterium]|jgi:hypothetical protein|nr:hypothetical protein [Catenulisporales bacterium]